MDGKQQEVENGPAYFGKMSFSVVSHLKQRHIEADIGPPHRTFATQIVLHLPNSNGEEIRQAKLNGQIWKEFRHDTISLPGNKGRLSVIAYY